MRPRSQRNPQPIGGVLVSYSAAEMPTPVIDRLLAENPDDLKVVRLLLRIAIQKLQALEAR